MYQFRCGVCNYDSGPCPSLDALAGKLAADGGEVLEVDGRFEKARRLWSVKCPAGHGGTTWDLDRPPAV